MNKVKLNKREIASSCIDFLLNKGNLYPLIPKRNLTILAYHGVMDVGKNYLYDIDCVSSRVEQFEDQIVFLKNNFNIITFSDYCEKYLSNNLIPDKTVIITFDDGYRNNYTDVYPILKKYNIPATIFLTAGLVSTDNLLWFDELSYILMACCQHKSLEVSVLGENIFFNLGSIESNRYAYRKIVKLFKRLSNNERIDELQSIKKKLSIDFQSARNSRILLNWSEIREMNENGIEFGSHSLTHPILTSMSDAESKLEIMNSKCIIEKQLGNKCIVFSYPNGSYSDREMRYVENSGYKLAVSYEHGVDFYPLKNNYEFKRVHIETYTSISQFRCGLSTSIRLI